MTHLLRFWVEYRVIAGYSKSRSRHRLFMKLMFVALFFCAYAMADTITLTMNEAPSQLIDGLTVSKGGVDFTFTNPERTLAYNSGGPGNVTFIQDPSIAGASSQFSVMFFGYGFERLVRHGREYRKHRRSIGGC